MEYKKLKHFIFSKDYREKFSYTSPQKGRTPNREGFSSDKRKSHGDFLKSSFESAIQSSINERKQYINIEESLDELGFNLEFEINSEFEHTIKSLEDQRAKIELLSLKKKEGSLLVTLYVPKGKQYVLSEKIEKYINENTKSGKAKNQDLIEGIKSINNAIFDTYWTDSKEVLPSDNEIVWWEIWLREIDLEKIEGFIKSSATLELIHDESKPILFPDRAIIYLKGNKSQIIELINISDKIAELRRAKETSEFLVNESNKNQVEWVNDLLERTTFSDSDSYITILDTGVNNGHKLINPVLKHTDLHTIDSSWEVNDNDGHGTGMAGICAYGDLNSALLSKKTLFINHKLESVKLIPQSNIINNPSFGYATEQCVYTVEIEDPNRKRNFCMAVASRDGRDKGQPSAWSGTLDLLTSGYPNQPKRLFFVSGGNLELNSINKNDYIDRNTLESIHDPGQSWNAVTVGAYTKLSTIKDKSHQSYKPIAPVDDLSPYSTTSAVWEDIWPYKPDIVLEGGNVAYNSHTKHSDTTDSLSLLTTSHRVTINQFTTFSATSAATAFASKMAAEIQSNYPNFYPETIRAIIIHSASWKTPMLNRFSKQKGKNIEYDYRNLLRHFGYGVPDLNLALWSSKNVLTLIVQDEIQPFIKDGTEIKTNEMHIHELPWPKEELQKFGDIDVEMRVTLSYFIEPSPGQKGWKNKYRYASHGLRFDVKTPEESPEQFRKRINEEDREKNAKAETSSDSKDWVLGKRLRSKGSIHSDIWKGSAAKLAERNQIAIFPVGGWWKDRKHLERYEQKSRYSLIITLSTPETEIDIYTPVKNIVTIKTSIEL